jgi:hypothetical protein
MFENSGSVQMYSNVYSRVRGVGAAGGIRASPRPHPQPWLTGNCTSVNISRNIGEYRLRLLDCHVMGHGIYYILNLLNNMKNLLFPPTEISNDLTVTEFICILRRWTPMCTHYRFVPLSLQENWYRYHFFKLSLLLVIAPGILESLSLLNVML